ncbi:GLPGLI family protein [Mesonia sp.]|uniref:GLPGLI family protein n=1 Tax=Mesonia sp. TaxID=1960830 RepID=UPI003F9A3420
MKYLFFLLIIVTNSIFAQTKVIKYHNSPVLADDYKEKLENLPKEKKELYSKILKKHNEDTQQLSYSLRFNDSVSSFETDPILFKNSSLTMDSQKYYYTNITNATVLVQQNIANQRFIVEKKLPDWSIKNESQQIIGFKAIKATATIKRYKSKGGINEVKVEAWFVPELPFSFGPIGYGGLPGLIVDLKLLGSHYSVIDLDLSSRNEKIEKPKKGKKIKESELQEVFKKINKRYK